MIDVLMNRKRGELIPRKVPVVVKNMRFSVDSIDC